MTGPHFRYGAFKRVGPGFLAFGELVSGEGVPIRINRGHTRPSTVLISKRGATEAEALASVRAMEPLGWKAAREGGWL